MSRPMRFPRRFPWLLVAPFVVLFGLPVFIPIVAWVWASGPPLRGYYLLAYVDSSERKDWPGGATTRIQWVYKTAPHRKAELATGSDVAANLLDNSGGKNPHAPFRLTPAAEGEGWTDVVVGPPVKVPSAPLAEYLKVAVYGGGKSLADGIGTPAGGPGGGVLFVGYAGMVDGPEEAGRAPRPKNQRPGAAARV